MTGDYGHFILRTAQGHVSLTFTGKPSARVRDALKANRFRWSPSIGNWWKQGGPYADFVESLRTMMDREAGIRRPDGKCWDCDQPGIFRNFGSATPVYCDACHANHTRPDDGGHCPDVDTMYEDQCQAACGL